MQHTRRPPLIATLLTAGILALGLAAPAAQASEVVKLARLVITGKWSSSPSAEPAAKAPAPEKQATPEPAAETPHGSSAHLATPAVHAAMAAQKTGAVL